MVNKENVDVSLLITFHCEGILAHSTLNSTERCRKFAEEKGISTEYVWVLDSVDAETRNVLMSHPAASNGPRIVEVSHRDLGSSRNAGIAVAHGVAIAILDGDDYFSANWIERAWHSLKEYGPRAILHPEVVVSFGEYSSYWWQVDQACQTFDKTGLLVGNYWTSWTFAFHSVYEQCPYVITRAAETGLGYEDWHWNCETIASGYEHRLASGSVGFYRKKRVSLVSATSAVGAIIPSTRLFDRGSFTEVAK